MIRAKARGTPKTKAMGVVWSSRCSASEPDERERATALGPGKSNTLLGGRSSLPEGG